MKTGKIMNEGNDREHVRTENEGGQAGRWELCMALACFIAAGIWSLFIGGWIRLASRIWNGARRWRDSRAERTHAGRYWFSNELNA